MSVILLSARSAILANPGALSTTLTALRAARRPAVIVTGVSQSTVRGGGRRKGMYYHTVAASGVDAEVKAQAKHHCNGTADNVEIQRAIAGLPS